MKNIGKDIIYQFAYRLITIITPFITSPYLSRILGPQKLGVYSGTYSYANYFVLLAMLGIEFYGSRSVAVVSDKKMERCTTFWNIYPIQFLAAMIAIIIYFSTFGLLFDENRYLICCLQGIWILSSGLDINWYFFGKTEFKVTVTRNIIVKLVSVICIFIFVKSENDLPKYVFIMSFSMVICQIIMWFFLLKDIGLHLPNLKNLKRNLKPIFLLFIPVIAMSIFHIMDKTMVDLLSNEANGGYYYNVDRLINIPLGLITGIGTVMLPRITILCSSAKKNELQNLLSNSAELSVALSSAIAFGLGSVAKIFVPVFFGKGYEPCVEMIMVFVPIIIIKSLSDFIRQQFLIPTCCDKIYVWAMLNGAFVNVVSNYFLIIKFGALGAVIGTFIAESIVLIFEIVGTYKKINFIKIFMRHISYLIIGMVMYLVIFNMSKYIKCVNIINLFLLILIGIFIYGFLCVVYWCKHKNNIFFKYVKSTIKSIKQGKGEKNG